MNDVGLTFGQNLVIVIVVVAAAVDAAAVTSTTTMNKFGPNVNPTSSM